MRLIDADELAKEWTIASPEPYNTDATEVLDSIRNAPAVDAVVITRCKGCKYAYINSFAVSSGEALCTLSGKPMQQDDFCSYGEPKEGNHD